MKCLSPLFARSCLLSGWMSRISLAPAKNQGLTTFVAAHPRGKSRSWPRNFPSRQDRRDAKKEPFKIIII